MGISLSHLQIYCRTKDALSHLFVTLCNHNSMVKSKNAPLFI